MGAVKMPVIGVIGLFRRNVVKVMAGEVIAPIHEARIRSRGSGRGVACRLRLGSRRRAEWFGRLLRQHLGHFFRRELDQLGHLALDLDAQRAFRDRGQQRLGLVQTARPPFGLVHVVARGQLVQQESRQGDGFAQAGPERLSAEFAHIGIGIVLGRQERKRIAMSSRSTGRQACRARQAARRPAPSPSKLKMTLPLARSSFFTWSGVVAVPSVATALAMPCCARPTTSM